MDRTESSTLTNQILATLSAQEYERLAPHLKRITLEVRDLLFDVNTEIRRVYFPESCVCSIVGLLADGSAVEIATIGNEGMVGLPIFHGTDRTSTQSFCQVPGTALAARGDFPRRGAKVGDPHAHSPSLFAGAVRDSRRPMSAVAVEPKTSLEQSRCRMRDVPLEPLAAAAAVQRRV